MLITYDLLSDENLREVCFLLGKNFLISSHKEKIPSFEKFKNEHNRLADSFKNGIDFILHELVQRISEDYFSVLEKIEYELDELENKALKNPKPNIL